VAVQELTDPSARELIGGRPCWRGHDYWEVIEPLLSTLGRDVGRDVVDSQLSYVGYLPGADEFVTAFDLWLDAQDPESDDPSEKKMACAIVRVRLAPRNEALVISAAGRPLRETFPFYGPPKRRLEEQHPELIDVRLD
jgi:hypothetical protein